MRDSVGIDPKSMFGRRISQKPCGKASPIIGSFVIFFGIPAVFIAPWTDVMEALQLVI